MSYALTLQIPHAAAELMHEVAPEQQSAAGKILEELGVYRQLSAILARWIGIDSSDQLTEGVKPTVDAVVIPLALAKGHKEVERIAQAITPLGRADRTLVQYGFPQEIDGVLRKAIEQIAAAAEVELEPEKSRLRKLVRAQAAQIGQRLLEAFHRTQVEERDGDENEFSSRLITTTAKSVSLLTRQAKSEEEGGDDRELVTDEREERSEASDSTSHSEEGRSETEPTADEAKVEQNEESKPAA